MRLLEAVEGIKQVDFSTALGKWHYLCLGKTAYGRRPPRRSSNHVAQNRHRIANQFVEEKMDMMKRYHGVVLVLAVAGLLAGSPAKAQVSVALPAGEIEAVETFTLDLSVGDLTGQGILSYEMDIEYDASVVKLTGVRLEGTLSEGKSVVANAKEEGIIRVAAASATSFEGSGVLLTLEGTVVKEASSSLTFTKFLFNEGEPTAATTDGQISISSPSSVSAETDEVPAKFQLSGNYPNPFNPSTTIRFDLPQTAEVSVQVFDLLGHRVLATPSQPMSAGADQTIRIDASHLASGTYVYRVIANAANATMSETRTMTLLK